MIAAIRLRCPGVQWKRGAARNAVKQALACPAHCLYFACCTNNKRQKTGEVMRRGSSPPPPLEETLTKALQAVSAVHEAMRDAQKHVSASYQSALLAKETRIATAIHPIAERLQAARGLTTFARMRLRGLLANVTAREYRRKSRREGI